MRISCSDVVSPSYFVATAAVELGYFKAEGVDVDFVPPPSDASESLKDGRLDFFAGSPYIALMAFPDWKGGKVLCALSQLTYWFLAVKASLNAKRGDLSAVKGLRISSSEAVGMTLRRLLKEGGIDLERDRVKMVPPPPPDGTGNLARAGARAIREDLADGFWGNAMRAEYAVKHGVATVLLDVRRGDGPSAARDYTFAALSTSDRLIQEHPDAAAGAVRAIVKTQQALKADPNLATQAAKRLFPEEELALIADQIARDAPFIDPHVSREAMASTARFAQEMGLISTEPAYEDVVATQFAPLWDDGAS